MTTTHMTRDPLAPIRSVRLESGYHGVYLKTSLARGRTPADCWVAKPFRKRYLSVHSTPLDAARAVVGWWRSRFGEHWPRYFRSRHARPWDTLADRKGGLVIDPRGFLVKVDIGYRLVVHVHGRERIIPPPDHRAVLFHSKEQAADHYHLWASQRFGLLSPLIIRGM